MFRIVLWAFWILHFKFSASVPATNNEAFLSEGSASHPFLTGVKFIPFKVTRTENVFQLEPVSQVQHSSLNNAQDQNQISKAQNLLPVNSLPKEILDKFALLPSFEPKKLSFVKEISLPDYTKNVDPSLFTNSPDTGNSNAAKLADAVKLPPLNGVELTNTVTNDAVKFISTANILPVTVSGLKNVDANSTGQLIANTFQRFLSADNTQPSNEVPQPPDLPKTETALPFPNLAFDPKAAISRKMIPPPETASFTFEQPEPSRLSEQITLHKQVPEAQALQSTNVPPISSNLAENVQIISVPSDKFPASVAKLPTQVLPPKEENLTELVDTVASMRYGILVSQMAAVLNASSYREDLPLIFQRVVQTQKTTHSPKKDVEVFAPMLPEMPYQPPAQPPQFPFYPGGSYPDETPFVVNSYPVYPPLAPKQPPTERPFFTRPTEEVTRPTEDTTRKPPKTTPTVPKVTPGVPKNTPKNTPLTPRPSVPKNRPSLPKNTPSGPRNTPSSPKNRPAPPKYTDPGESNYTPDEEGHSWVTRFYPGYPPTTKPPLGMPSPIWPMFTPQPTLSPQKSSMADNMVTPFMERLISATSTAATPAVQILGEPSPVEPKYKLAVVSDYKNYDPNDGTFGFSIDLENGLTAKVRGYKKNGRHYIQGSYSLFANEGDPVNITYIADNEAPEIMQDEQQLTNIQLPLSAADSNTTPTTNT